MAYHSVEQAARAAVALARTGQIHRARQQLWRLASAEPGNIHAWLALAYVAHNAGERRAALWRALCINPSHHRVRQALLALLNAEATRKAALAGVFISYTRSDELFAAQLAEDLRFLDVPAWIDVLDMPEGGDWDEAIAAAMRQSGLMLVVGSPQAMRAHGVQHEVRQFMDAGKIVLPAQYRPCDFTLLNLWQPPIDFSQDYNVGLQTLVSMLTQPEPARV